MNMMNIELEPLKTTARGTELLCSLPAVATPDRCDQAAAAFVSIEPRATAISMILTIDTHGNVLDLEASGVATGDDVSGSGMLNLLRSRAERFRSLGWPITIDHLRQGFAGSVRRFSAPRDWRTGPFGKLWSDLSASEIIVGVAPLGQETPGRCVMIQVAFPEAGGVPTAQREAVVGSLMPTLATRTIRSLGVWRTSSNDWLTAREALILEHLTLGRSVREIADLLERSPHTVHDHVKSMHRKLNASSRGELIARALGHPGMESRVSAKAQRPASTTEAKPQAAKAQARKTTGTTANEVKPLGSNTNAERH